MRVVKQGECLDSIAVEVGLASDTIWKDLENEELRKLRESPNLLKPGDRVFIRDLEQKQEPAATAKRHRFKVKNVPAVLKLRLLNNGEPRKEEGWKALIAGVLQRGNTDKDGNIELTVRPDEGLIRLEMESGATFDLDLRHLDPLETVSGVQGRLRNLGYDTGPIDGIQGPITTGAVKMFQADHPPLEVDGIVGPKTRAKLKEVYGC